MSPIRNAARGHRRGRFALAAAVCAIMLVSVAGAASAEPARTTPLLSRAGAQQLQKAFAHVSNRQLIEIATGNHVERVGALYDRELAKVPRRGLRGWLFKGKRKGLERGRFNATIGSMLERAPNSYAILEIGRRGLSDQLSLLERIATGELKVEQGGAVVSPRGDPQRSAILALALADGNKAVPVLQKLANSGTMASYATELLGKIGGKDARRALRSALDKAGRWDAIGIKGKLVRLGDTKYLPELARDFNQGSEFAWEALLSIGPTALKSALRHQDAEVRFAALRTIGSLDGKYSRDNYATEAQYPDLRAGDFKADVQHAATRDASARNRSKAIKFLAELYGPQAIVEAFTPLTAAAGRKSAPVPALAQRVLQGARAERGDRRAYVDAQQAREMLAGLGGPQVR